MSPFSVAIVTLVMGLLRSWVADRHLGHGNRVGWKLDTAGSLVDRVDRLHPLGHGSNDLVGVGAREDRLVLVVEDDEELRADGVRSLRPGHRDGPSDIRRRDRLV